MKKGLYLYKAPSADTSKKIRNIIAVFYRLLCAPSIGEF